MSGERRPMRKGALETGGTTLSAVLGANVRLGRLINGMTQRDLADKVGTVQNAISRIELGDVNVNLATLEKLAKSFGCSPAQLLTPRDQAHESDQS